MLGKKYLFHLHTKGAPCLFLRCSELSQGSWCQMGAPSTVLSPQAPGQLDASCNPTHSLANCTVGKKPVFFQFNGFYPFTKFKIAPKPRSVLQAAPWALCCLFAVKSHCRSCTPPISILISSSM